MENRGVCGPDHLAPGISSERSSGSKMKECLCLWCRTELGNPAIANEMLFTGALGLHAQSARASSSLSEINAAANPSRVFACQALKKTIKRLHTHAELLRQVDGSAGVCGPRDDTFIRRWRRRRDAQGRQLNDPQQTIWRTQENKADGAMRRLM